MNSDFAASLSPPDRVRMSHGYSFKAKAVSKRSTIGSHTHGGHSQAARGFECDQPNGAKSVPGWAKVSMPRNHVRFCRPADEPRRGPGR